MKLSWWIIKSWKVKIQSEEQFRKEVPKVDENTFKKFNVCWLENLILGKFRKVNAEMIWRL